MIPSSPTLYQTTNLNIHNNFAQNTFSKNQQLQQNKQHQAVLDSEQQFGTPKAFQLNFTNIMKNNENYEMNLASNSNFGINSAQRDFYSQTQRSLIQNPMVLNPEQFNNSNNARSKMNEITMASSTVISQEKLKDVNKYFI